MLSKRVVIFKNDATGDLIHSLPAIYNIINDNDISEVIIYLSTISKKFQFLVDQPKVKIKLLNYNLNIYEKFKLIYFFITNNISKAYILAPKKFFYFLPIFFFRIKFYAICVNNINNYKRPSSFLRKFLYKYEINDRSALFKRESALKLQKKLTSNKSSIDTWPIINEEISENLKKYLPKNFYYFHLKKKRLNELGWSINELNLLFEEFLKYSDNIVLTKDIEDDENTKILKQNFSSFNFNTLKFLKKNDKIIFFDKIDGIDLYNVIKLSKKIITFHGMLTGLGFLNKKPVLDLYHCNIKNWNDYRNYRNSFYEFKPKYVGYDFIIPSKNIQKTIKKIRFSLKK